MKKRQLIIRGILLISLVSILGMLSLLYLVFCHDGNYNSAPVEMATTVVEDTTEQPSSVPETEEPVTDSVENTDEEGSVNMPVIGENYNPAEELAGENWALTLINKSYPLDKHYVPDTTVIDGSAISVDTRVAENYKKMYDAALEDDIILKPYSGYCNYQRQKIIFDGKVDSFLSQGQSNQEAKQNAERRVGAPGCSENGAGLAVDLRTSADFNSTNEYKWLVANAHKYGFILRYPEDKTEITGMIYQPWHWRYVGVEAATEMKEKNLCLEEYLGAV